MIEQQLYSRSSNGLTIHGPGHDTVAASAGLTNTYLKELNEYCIYYDGKILSSSGEQIPIVSRRFLLDGKVLFSRRMPRKYTDSSGRRLTFLMHNFIIDPDSKEYDDLNRDVRKICDPTIFISHFDDAKSSSELPQLSEFPMMASYGEFDAINFVLSKGIVSEKLFFQIVSAVIASITGDSSVIIINPNPDTEAIPVFIIEAICNFLPYSLRKRFTFTTLQGDANSEYKYNLRFAHPLCKEQIINSGYFFDEYVKDDFVFDLTEEKLIYGDPTKSNDMPYVMQMMKDKISSPETLVEFFNNVDDFAKRISVSEIKLKDIENIYGLFSINKTNQNQDVFCLFNIWYDYRTDRNRKVLDEVLLKVIDKAVKSNHPLPNDILEKVLKIASSTSEIFIDRYIDEIIYPAIEAVSNNGVKALNEQIDICNKYIEIGSIVMSRLFIENETVGTTYFGYKFDKIASIEECLNFYLNIENSDIFKMDNKHIKDMDYIHNLVINVLKKTLGKYSFNDGEKILSEFEKVRTFIKKANNTALNKKIKIYLAAQIVSWLEIDVVKSLSLENIDYAYSIVKSEFIREDKLVGAYLDAYNLLLMIKKCVDDPECLLKKRWITNNPNKNTIDYLCYNWIANYYSGRIGRKIVESDFYAVTMASYDLDARVLSLSKSFEIIARNKRNIGNYYCWLIRHGLLTNEGLLSGLYIESYSGKIIDTNGEPRRALVSLLNVILLVCEKVVAPKLSDQKIKKKFCSDLLEKMDMCYLDDYLIVKPYFSKEISRAVSGGKFSKLELDIFDPQEDKTTDEKGIKGFIKSTLFKVICIVLAVLIIVPPSATFGMFIVTKIVNEKSLSTLIGKSQVNFVDLNFDIDDIEFYVKNIVVSKPTKDSLSVKDKIYFNGVVLKDYVKSEYNTSFYDYIIKRLCRIQSASDKKTIFQLTTVDDSIIIFDEEFKYCRVEKGNTVYYYSKKDECFNLDAASINLDTGKNNRSYCVWYDGNKNPAFASYPASYIFGTKYCYKKADNSGKLDKDTNDLIENFDEKKNDIVYSINEGKKSS